LNGKNGRNYFRKKKLKLFYNICFYAKQHIVITEKCFVSMFNNTFMALPKFFD